MPKKLLFDFDAEGFEEWEEKRSELLRKLGPTDPHKEYQDIETVTSQFLKEGQNVVEIFGGGFTAIPSFIKSKIGRKGHVYSIDRFPRYEYELFVNFVLMLDSYKTIPLRLKLDPHFFDTGTPLRYIRNADFLSELAWALRTVDANHVKNLADLADNSQKLGAKKELLEMAKKIYTSIGIEPVTKVLPPYPEMIRDSSVDAVVEREGFDYCREDLKEGIIIDTDRILKPDGYLILKDTPEELIKVLYYGDEMFKERYSQIIPKGMNYPYDWLVFKKER